jgi:hypothetical protein
MSDLWSILIFGRLAVDPAETEVEASEAEVEEASVTCYKRKREVDVQAYPAILNTEDPVGAEIIAFITNLQRIEENMQEMIEKFSRMRI